MNKSWLTSMRTAVFPEAYFGIYAFVACVVLFILTLDYPEDTAICFRLCLSIVPILAIDIGIMAILKSPETMETNNKLVVSSGIVLNILFLTGWTLL